MNLGVPAVDNPFGGRTRSRRVSLRLRAAIRQRDEPDHDREADEPSETVADQAQISSFKLDQLKRGCKSGTERRVTIDYP